MKKKVETNRNMFEWHTNKLAKRTQRRAKKQAEFVKELGERQPSDRKIRLRANIALNAGENKRLLEAVGIDPKYMSSKTRKRIYGNNESCHTVYAEKVDAYKKKIRQDAVDKHKAEHPGANVFHKDI